jgi:hypothetical protein
MKTVLVLMTTIASTTVFASSFKSITSLTNPSLDSAASVISKVDGIYGSSLEKVLVLKAKGATAQEQRRNTIAQAAHMLCGFFDDGVNVALNSTEEKGSKSSAETILDNNLEDQDGAVFKSISSVNGKDGIEVYSGTAGGNNTAGTVLGFYDTTNNELAVFANTNCGSDE